MGDRLFEIIGIHDAKSLSEGYNRGFARSSGDICIFSHDDIHIYSTDFADKVIRYLKSFDIIGPAGTSKLLDGYWIRAGKGSIHGQILNRSSETGQYSLSVYDGGEAAWSGRTIDGNLQALDGVFLAMRREVFEKASFDEDAFDGFHSYDIDFTYSAFRAGLKLGAFYDIAILHESHGSYDASWEDYNRIFVVKHRHTLPTSFDIPTAPAGVGIDHLKEVEFLDFFGPDAKASMETQFKLAEKKLLQLQKETRRKRSIWRMLFNAIFKKSPHKTPR
jgi:8-oxo-dGTP pyrophosphatase MutT (NUDIX family)